MAETETIDDLLAAKLRKGESSAAWCARNGVSYRMLYRYRRGLVDRPHPESLGRLARCFGVSVQRVRRAFIASQAAAA